MDEQGTCEEKLGAYLLQDGDSALEQISEGKLVVLAGTGFTQSRTGDRDQFLQLFEPYITMKNAQVKSMSAASDLLMKELPFHILVDQCGYGLRRSDD